MNRLDRMRLDRGAAHLHALGERAVAELLAEVAGSIGGVPCILTLLAAYERMPAATFRRIGADRIHRPPPREVPTDLMRRQA